MLTSLSDSCPKNTGRKEIIKSAYILCLDISINVHAHTKMHRNEFVHTFKHEHTQISQLYPSLEAAKTLFPPCPGATHHEVIELLADGCSSSRGCTLQALSWALW